MTQEKLSLSPAMLSAADLVATGVTIADAARRCHVARATVSRWWNHNTAFRARVEERQTDAWRDASQLLRAFSPEAARVLGRELKGSNKLRASIELLKLSQQLDTGLWIRTTDAVGFMSKLVRGIKDQ